MFDKLLKNTIGGTELHKLFPQYIQYNMNNSDNM